MAEPKQPRRRLRRALFWGLASALLLVSLFAVNGLWLANNETAIGGGPQGDATAPSARIKIMVWNLAKGFAHRGGLSFDDAGSVRERMRAIAELVRQEQPDLLFLSEAIVECTPCPVDQVALLRELTGLRHWVFGENYNFGLPFLRVVGGNAILSRFPLTPVANPDLAGRRPFWATFNNRRVLLADVVIGGTKIRLAAMHTDSFDLDNNRRQTEQILRLCAGTPTILAGDFNAEPDDPPLQAVSKGNRFAGALRGDPTFPAQDPQRRIDYVFAPKEWRLVEHRVADERTSDHRPVVSVFALPRR